MVNYTCPIFRSVYCFNLKFGIEYFTDPGLLKIRLTLTGVVVVLPSQVLISSTLRRFAMLRLNLKIGIFRVVFNLFLTRHSGSVV